MTGYNVKVYLYKLHCRDTESLHSSDRIALAGAVTTDRDANGFVVPSFRINDEPPDDVHEFGNALIFDGPAEAAKLGLIVQAWDLDENAPWIDNKADIIKASQEISDEVKKIPVYGTVAGIVLDAIIKIVPPIIDQFVEWDKNDQLLNYQQWWDPPTADLAYGEPVPQDITIPFHHTDGIGYSSWDYTLDLYAVWTANTPLLPPVVNFSPDEMAMNLFRSAADDARAAQLVGAFPTFVQSKRGLSTTNQEVLLYATQHRDKGVVYADRDWSPQPVAEWRDVPLASLSNVDLRDVRARIRATQTYAVAQGFAAGFPNFYHADYGNGTVCGTVLLTGAGADVRRVPLSDLGDPAPDDIAAMFRAVQAYAVTQGFLGGFPNFDDEAGGQAHHGQVQIEQHVLPQFGVVLIKAMGGVRRNDP